MIYWCSFRIAALIAAPTFAAWRMGQDLDVARWMEPVDGKTPATIISVAHLDDDERTMVLGVILEEVLAWVRCQQGTTRRIRCTTTVLAW